MATITWNNGRYYYSSKWSTWTFSSPVTSTVLNGNQYLGTSSTGGTYATMWSMTLTPSAGKQITALSFKSDLYNDSSSAKGSNWGIYTYVYASDPGQVTTRPTGYIGYAGTSVSSSTIGYRSHHLVTHNATLTTPITEQTTVWIMLTCNGGTSHPLNWLLTTTAHNKFTVPQCTVTEAAWTPPTSATLTLSKSTANVGETITLTASATGGTPTTYTFYKSTDSGSNWTLLQSSSSTTCSYTVGAKATDNGAYFRVYAQNNDGGVYSNTPSLTVKDPVLTTTLTISPATPVTVGDSVTLTATYTGGIPTSYNFQRSRDSGSSWTSIQNTSSSTCGYTVLSDDNGAYFRVIASNSDGSSASASVILLIILHQYIKLKHNGSWKNSIAYVLHNGVWYEAKSFVLHNNEWKPTKTQ